MDLEQTLGQARRAFKEGRRADGLGLLDALPPAHAVRPRVWRLKLRLALPDLARDQDVLHFLAPVFEMPAGQRDQVWAQVIPLFAELGRAKLVQTLVLAIGADQLTSLTAFHAGTAIASAGTPDTLEAEILTLAESLRAPLLLAGLLSSPQLRADFPLSAETVQAVAVFAGAVVVKPALRDREDIARLLVMVFGRAAEPSAVLARAILTLVEESPPFLGRLLHRFGHINPKRYMPGVRRNFSALHPVPETCAAKHFYANIYADERLEFAALFGPHLLHGTDAMITHLFRVATVSGRGASLIAALEAADGAAFSPHARFQYACFRKTLDRHAAPSRHDFAADPLSQLAADEDVKKVLEIRRLRYQEAALVRTSKAVRIGVCVSGQMRDYQKPAAALRTLFKSGGVEVDFYIHTWKSTGHKLPLGVEDVNLRALPPRFREAWRAVQMKTPWTKPMLAASFPGLYRALSVAGEADAGLIAATYDTEYVVIEDEAAPALASLVTNQHKMLYKMKAVQDLALAERDYSHILRIRPDRWVREGQSTAPLLEQLTPASVFTDGGAGFNTWLDWLMTGDQVAFGQTLEMAHYADALDLLTAFEGRGVPGFDRVMGHINIAAGLAYAGVSIRPLPLDLHPLGATTETFAASTLLSALQEDQSSADQAVVQSLMAAAAADIAAGY